ncbi:LysR substrate-binding domain-containing protein [Hoeflea sp. TYP-13]|uniref:LysR substrate-binding domain-containing protein n=1 Tax=Hoeflea sp. TYP-13 TaxID=3230023 RepID=UPI0034C6950C
MERKFRHVPGYLHALLVLEAAARHSSFTRAGHELSLTQPTVSRHITVLEERLGQALFHRNNNRIRPTEAGRRLADAVALGIGHTETVWDELARKDPGDELVMACTFGFADQWLMPRFSELRQALKGKRVRVATSDWMEHLDMEQIDVAIVSDPSDDPSRTSVPLFAEDVFPVCSRDYLADHPELADNPHAIAKAQLLHFDIGKSGFMTWQSWFTHCGVPPPPSDKSAAYDAYPFLLHAAQNGAGVALGWRVLVDRMIEDGSLVQIGPAIRNRDTAYYAQYRTTGPKAETSLALVCWIKAALED